MELTVLERAWLWCRVSPTRGALVLALAWAVLTGCCSACVAHIRPPVSAAIETRARAATALVGSACIEKSRVVWRHGSGVVLGPHRIVTALHVLPCRTDAGLSVRVPDIDDPIPARLAATVDDEDLAILETDRELPYVAPAIAPPGTGPGTVCLAAAWPERSFRCGRVTALDRDKVWHTIRSIPGNSGGGIYDAQGRLVAIHTNGFALSPGGYGRPLIIEVFPW